MPHRFPRPATAGCMARIWKPYGPQPATGEPAIGKRGFTSGFPTLYKASIYNRLLLNIL